LEKLEENGLAKKHKEIEEMVQSIILGEKCEGRQLSKDCFKKIEKNDLAKNGEWDSVEKSNSQISVTPNSFGFEDQNKLVKMEKQMTSNDDNDDESSRSSSNMVTLTEPLSGLVTEWNNILEEEKRFNRTYEEVEQQWKAKVYRKQCVEKQLQVWLAFLRRWKEWDIYEFYSFLIHIENRQFAKYFHSAEDVNDKWTGEHYSPFKGEDLMEVDREDLRILGVTDKEDRKLLANQIRSLYESTK